MRKIAFGALCFARRWKIFAWGFLLLPLFFSHAATAQDAGKKIAFGQKDQSLQKGLDKVGELSGFRLSYTLQDVEKYDSITVEKGTRSVTATLNLLLEKTNLTYLIRGQNILILPRSNQPVIISATADDATVQGTVTDLQNNPLGGIYVQIKGTNKGTLTNDNGVYVIRAPKDAALLFSYVGVNPLEEVINGRKTVNVVLKVEARELKQMVVTGYSDKKAAELTGSVVQLSGTELMSGVPATTDVYELLKGKVPGLLGTTIRGSSAISTVGPTTPLIVLDGNVMGNVDINELVNPQDIETISILKDAASTAIYGSRSALGVIVVVTKRGKQGMKVTVNNRSGMTTYPHRLKYMNTAQWMDHVNKYLGGLWSGYATTYGLDPDSAAFIQESQLPTADEAKQNFNWDKAFHDNGYYNDLNVGFSSGNKQSSIYGSLGWYKERGATLGSYTDRKTAKMNVDFTLSPKVTLSFTTGAVITKSTAQNGQLDAINYLPWWTPKDANGNWNKTLSMPVSNFPTPGNSYVTIPNVLYEHATYDNTYITNDETYMGAFTLRYKPIPELTLQTSNNIRHNILSSNSYYDPRSYSGRLGLYSTVFALAPWFPTVNASGTLDLSNAVTNTYSTSNTVNFRKQYGKHLITVLGGQEFSITRGETNAISYYTILPGERNAGAATYIGDFNAFAYGLPYTPSGSQTESGMFSAFGEGSYRYDQRYTLTGSVRTDASSSFGKNNRYGTFYSLSGAWQVDQERFMASLRKTVTSLKLRYAYGTSGRDLGGYYLNKTYYSNTASYNGVSQSGSVISQLANNNIKWETTFNHALGTDFSILNRLNMTIDLYHRRSAGLVQAFTLPATEGGYTQQTNIGEVVNKGLEVSLNGDVVRRKGFFWNLSGNISFNKNRITKMSAGTRTFVQQPGHAIGDVYAIPYVGVNADDGAPLFLMGNGSKTEGLTTVAEADTLNQRKVGNTTPKYYGGIRSAWYYHGFTLAVECYFEVGAVVSNYDIYTNTDPSAAYFSAQNNYIFPSTWKIWSGKGDTKANMPNIYDPQAGYWYFYSTKNSLFYQNASFFRIRNIRLNYDIPRKVAEKLSMSNASIFFNADNVYVFKHKSNWRDAESVNSPLRLVVGLNIGL